MNKKLIHVKIGYDEMLQSKKDILESQIAFINIIKIMQRYKAFRAEELKLKIGLDKGIKQTLKNIRKMQKELPKLGINIAKKFETKESKTDEIEELSKKIEKKYNDTLEQELREIQNKLRFIAQQQERIH